MKKAAYLAEVNDDCKVASNVAMSTYVSSWSWSEKAKSSSWTKPSAAGGTLGADKRQRPPTGLLWYSIN